MAASGFTVTVKITDSEDFMSIVKNCAEMLKDERIPIEIRQEYYSKIEASLEAININNKISEVESNGLF